MKLVLRSLLKIISGVAPFAGVWIEIGEIVKIININEVAPFAGVWIEIYTSTVFSQSIEVAPFAGVWIEIKVEHCLQSNSKSHPSRVCGLK